ncbi:molecular chaperone HtpG [Lutibaculum baratangense]|uniref:Chaperone protein HtpG n=1 Tax=Lutibaculum baratangense AMV1 TaxID=631454 RepID=V4R204_9HYPH|nr:molecular chaperone HtpG [Lutibaculum baratangense]ESR25957.1 Chaperone protein HtpG [Lutibaculum baratangense AMV1]
MAETDSAAQAATSHAFEAEVDRLLDLVVHAVYSDRELFLRELVSNAADACEKLRFEARRNDALLKDDPDLRITILPDAGNGTLEISDNGIGMSREDLQQNLGTIARSGTRAFVEALHAGEEAKNLIGRFGIGFYSAFMVADRVEVLSRRAGEEQGHRWSSTGSGAFEIASADDAPSRGTRVILHLKENAREFAEEHRLEHVIRSHSGHVPIPIRLGKDGAFREITDGSALWLKPKSEISADDYADFYRHVGGQFDEPSITIHYSAEGRQAYHVLLFVPSERPFDLFDPERKGRVRLYVRRVFITDEADLLPSYLRFVRGLVDSDDLPLNISREMLQESPMLSQIKKGITNRVVSELKKRAEKEPEGYLKIWQTFGNVLKEGLYEDFERRGDLLELARFRTTKSGEDWRSLKEIVADFRENQSAIYYVTADSHAQAAASPQLEGFRARDIEVILLSDPVDHFWARMAPEFDGKPFRSITQGAADISNIPRAAAAEDGDEAPTSDVATLAALVKQTLGDVVGEVRPSDRLAESPVCLVAKEGALDRRLERMIRRQENNQIPGTAPDLELNPRHRLIRHLSAEAAKGGASERLADAAWLLWDEAAILEGEAPSDPAAFAARLTRLLLPSEPQG